MGVEYQARRFRVSFTRERRGREFVGQRDPDGYGIDSVFRLTLIAGRAGTFTYVSAPRLHYASRLRVTVNPRGYGDSPFARSRRLSTRC